ncbi:MAG TPA: (Fe-S)-binding protein [Candidatus Eisenbacteria bacterium]|nr:(Fe-S)-binding protein [Candidatus Eisenbacteria bacterium]
MSETTISQGSGVPGLQPSYEDYARCVHCGLCLNHCPTYKLWHLEADSPRGRIFQMIRVKDGEAPVNATFVEHIDKCLDCRACETACPSGVEYGKLVEFARARIAVEYKRPFFSRLARKFVYRWLLPRPGRIAFFARLFRIYQKSGLQTLARKTGVLRAMGLAEREALMPRVDDEFFFRRLGKTFPALGETRARVAFFGGCLAQVMFAELNEATIRVLTANGCEVTVPRQQVCCGALASHAGDREAARGGARRNLRAFGGDEFDSILTNAAGCGSTLKEYSHLFSEGEPEYEAAKEFESRVRDVTEFLNTLGLVAPMKGLATRITYQDSCHLLHGQKVREAPRRLLKAMPGIEFVELPSSEICCGSAGVYNVTETEASMELLAEKMKNAAATGAETIVTANPGCLLQMRAGAHIYKTGQRVLHVMELLDRAILDQAIEEASAK